MKAISLRALTLGLTALFSIGQAAAWEISVDGPDVFGVTKVLTFQDGAEGSLVVQCNSENDLFIALVYPKKEFESIEESAAIFLVKGGSSQPVRADAVNRVWNDNRGGVVISGKSPEAMTVVREIEDAVAQIQVGVDYGTNKASTSFAAQGSSQAMKTVIEKCNLESIGSPPA